ncbi:hypothetical protein [Candidatus Absconditicoccus praedator]|uniref:hypothetical protein n=1 Tax=Candidatus Absconditicoccus praedator TaxID=2735562 RepID=UPI001E5A44C9|nr:hypothetical protein [Candidatus Absconditicoccus praedator]UFX83316.1 hypothetical protein HLG78_04275 [Candidatus Absconditicoccus praedator]
MTKRFSEAFRDVELPEPTGFLKSKKFVDVNKLEIRKLFSPTDLDDIPKVDLVGDVGVLISYKGKPAHILGINDEGERKIFVGQIQGVKGKEGYRVIKGIDVVGYYAAFVASVVSSTQEELEIDVEKHFETADLKAIERVYGRYINFLNLLKENLGC